MAIPYRDGGRDERGLDCLGLYLLVLVREAGLRLADHDVSYGRDPLAVVRRIEAEIASGAWAQVELARARPLDAVHMTGVIHTGPGRAIRGAVHMGVYLGAGRVMHTEKPAGVQVMRLSDPRLARRVLGVYRPQALRDIEVHPCSQSS